MPTYEYKCLECKERFDVSGDYSTLFSYKPVCPKCHKKNIKKLIGKPTIIFKGSGFYKTDSNTS